MSDFDDLFGSPTGRTQRTDSAVSPVNTPRTARLPSSPPGFANNAWDDGFSSNPFADLQSNSIAGFTAISSPGISPPSAGTDHHAIGSPSTPTRHEGDIHAGHARQQSDDAQPSLSTRPSYASGVDGGIDRVMVSPIASRTASESDMLRAYSAEGKAFGHQQDLAQEPISGSTSSGGLFEASSSPWTEDVTYTVAAAGDAHAEQSTPQNGKISKVAAAVVPANENTLRPRNIRGDSASIRTVGLESDAGSMRSQPGALLRPEPMIPALLLQADAAGKSTFIITVGDPTKVSAALSLGDALTSHTVYTITTRTSSTYFKKHDFSVLRRYSDFLWLIERLNANNPGVIVPAIPGKIIVGRFAQGVVESRRLALQDCLQHIVRHELLVTDPDLRIFLESDAFYTDSRQRAAASTASTVSDLSQTAASRLFSIPGLTSPRFVEFDDFFATRKAQIDALEVALKSLSHSLSISSRTTASIDATAAEVATSLQTLSICELGENAKEAILRLSDLQAMKAETASIVGRSMESDLFTTFDTSIRLIGSIRAAFQSRVKMYHAWQRTEAAVRATQTAHDRAKRQSKTHPDLVTLALADVTEAERAAITAKREFEDSTALLKRELGRIDEEKTEMCRQAVLRFTTTIAERQATVVEAWKAYVNFLDTSMAAHKDVADKAHQT